MFKAGGQARDEKPPPLEDEAAIQIGLQLVLMFKLGGGCPGSLAAVHELRPLTTRRLCMITNKQITHSPEELAADDC